MSRAGASLAEAVTVLALAAIMVTAIARYVSQLEALSRQQAALVERAGSIEAARSVLEAELRYLAPELDLHALSPDSVAGRFFRGVGRVCGDGLRVDYRGLRLPDPDKDSLLFPGAGTGRAHPVEAATAATCADGSGPAIRIETDTAPGVGLVLVFERGSYHVGEDGLRYRRGRGGRQPLTGRLEPEIRFAPFPGAAADTAGIALRSRGRQLHGVPFLNLAVGTS